VLRIEDTDVERNREEWVGGIESALEWLQMAPDEGPFRQSAQDERHRVAIDALFEAGFLYACDCTREEIANARRTTRPWLRRLLPGAPPRSRSDHRPALQDPHEGSTTVVDLIRARSSSHTRPWTTSWRESTGQPLFALANRHRRP